jgi:hydroxyacyl-ACP dehydratase HTD2-like protein with hotdog domain
MDEDSAYFQALDGERPIAPPLFPTHMFRRGFGEPDVVSERAGDPDYDGAIASSSRGLPDLPLPNMVRLNGGVEVEFFRYARHGERVVMKSRYAEIVEREGSKGPMVLAKVDTDYLTGDGALLLRVRNTGIYRTAS